MHRWIFLALLSLLCPALAQPASRPAKPQLIGAIEHKAISESSGIVASRKHPGVFWTHCDSGNDATIYAITREGKLVGEFETAAHNDDWEDIAIDDQGRLYVGDVGNNGGRKKKVEVYRFDEPDPKSRPGENGAPEKLKPTHRWNIAYPDEPFDCEAMFIFKDHAYLISKGFTGLAAGLYRFPLDDTKKQVTLEKLCNLAIRTPVTGASISPDGKRLAVLDMTGLNMFQIDGDPANAGKARPQFRSLIVPGIEACSFTEGGVLVTAESREIYFFADP